MATYYATKAYIVRLSESIREEIKKENKEGRVKMDILRRALDLLRKALEVYPGRVEED